MNRTEEVPEIPCWNGDKCYPNQQAGTTTTQVEEVEAHARLKLAHARHAVRQGDKSFCIIQILLCARSKVKIQLHMDLTASHKICTCEEVGRTGHLAARALCFSKHCARMKHFQSWKYEKKTKIDLGRQLDGRTSTVSFPHNPTLPTNTSERRQHDDDADDKRGETFHFFRHEAGESSLFKTVHGRSAGTRL